MPSAGNDGPPQKQQQNTYVQETLESQDPILWIENPAIFSHIKRKVEEPINLASCLCRIIIEKRYLIPDPSIISDLHIDSPPLQIIIHDVCRITIFLGNWCVVEAHDCVVGIIDVWHQPTAERIRWVDHSDALSRKIDIF
jgi:hypothetical protein